MTTLFYEEGGGGRGGSRMEIRWPVVREDIGQREEDIGGRREVASPPPTDVTNRTLKISFETKAEFGSGVVFLPDFSRWMKKNFKGGGRDGRLFGQVWTALRRADFFF